MASGSTLTFARETRPSLEGPPHLQRSYLLLGQLRGNGALGPQIVELIGGEVNHGLCDVQGTSYTLHVPIDRHSSHDGQPNARILIGTGSHFTGITPTILGIPVRSFIVAAPPYNPTTYQH